MKRMIKVIGLLVAAMWVFSVGEARGQGKVYPFTCKEGEDEFVYEMEEMELCSSSKDLILSYSIKIAVLVKKDKSSVAIRLTSGFFNLDNKKYGKIFRAKKDIIFELSDGGKVRKTNKNEREMEGKEFFINTAGFVLFDVSCLRTYDIVSVTIDAGKSGKATIPLTNCYSAATINAMLNKAGIGEDHLAYGLIEDTEDASYDSSSFSGNTSSNSSNTTVPHTALQTTAAKKTAEIISMKTRHSEEKQGTYVTVDFFVHNMKGKTGGINIYFFSNDGTPLKDINKNEVSHYSTPSGEVAVGEQFTPDHDHLHYTAYELFIPDSEMHLAAGNYVLKYYCAIFDDEVNQIATSKWQTMSFYSTGLASSAQKSAKVLAMDAEHNVFRNGQKGMNILVNFDVSGMNGKRGEVIAYFYFDDMETPLKDFNKRNYTVNGNVCASEYYEPPYDNATYTKFKIFIPYNELHLNSGHYSLKYYCVVFDNSSKELTRSDWQGMTYTKN